MQSFKLRDYQQQAKADLYEAWQTHDVPCLVLPTGAGKTVILGSVVSEHKGAACVIAHRTELVSQISLAIARYGVRHKIIGPTSTVKQIVTLHNQILGASFYDPHSQVAVAGVDTLIRRADDPWFKTVTLYVIDEAHHVLRDNKWGKASQLFPNAKGLQVTATPCRADKKGLGSHADGLTDCLIEGPSMRELINRGFLTDYRIFAPPCTSLDLDNVPLAASGDYSKPKLTTAVRKSTIIGDVVEHYLKITPGSLGVTFATDVETATDISQHFNSAGVPAEIVSAKTNAVVRNQILTRFKAGDLKQLVNVDLFGEGFDLPAIEVVSMARPTQSYALYSQQFGRALRPMEGKDKAIIIDHVGNVIRHNGPPDRPQIWTLNRGEKRSSKGGDTIPFTACTTCTMVYEKYHTACPFCGFKPTPTQRSGPEFVDGDLYELDAEALARLRGDVARVDSDFDSVRSRMEHAGAAPVAINSAAKSHKMRQEAQSALRVIMSYWGGKMEADGYDIREAQKIFYYRFGVDVMTAQTLGRREAEELTNKINGDFL